MAQDAIPFLLKRGIVEDLIYHWHLPSFQKEEKKSKIQFLSHFSVDYVRE